MHCGQRVWIQHLRRRRAGWFHPPPGGTASPHQTVTLTIRGHHRAEAFGRALYVGQARPPGPSTEKGPAFARSPSHTRWFFCTELPRSVTVTKDTPGHLYRIVLCTRTAPRFSAEISSSCESGIRSEGRSSTQCDNECGQGRLTRHPRSAMVRQLDNRPPGGAAHIRMSTGDPTTIGSPVFFARFYAAHERATAQRGGINPRQCSRLVRHYPRPRPQQHRGVRNAYQGNSKVVQRQ